jgi:hypothetical protein
MPNTNNIEKIQNVKLRLTRILLFSTLIFLTGLLSNIPMRAQCPDGYQQRTITMTVNGCVYEADLCVYCTIGPRPSSAMISAIRKLDINCEQSLTFSQVVQQIESQVFTYDYLYMLCGPHIADPCPNHEPPYDPNEIWTINHWVCWNMERISYNGDLAILYRPCDYDNYCIETGVWCLDYSTTPPTPVWTRIEPVPYMVGTVTCTLEGWEVLVPDELDQPSACFIYHTPCNP